RQSVSPWEHSPALPLHTWTRRQRPARAGSRAGRHASPTQRSRLRLVMSALVTVLSAMIQMSIIAWSRHRSVTLTWLGVSDDTLLTGHMLLEYYVAVPDVFQILADPTRRRLVEALQTGAHSVSELVEAVDIRQPADSLQLGILQDAR